MEFHNLFRSPVRQPDSIVRQGDAAVVTGIGNEINQAIEQVIAYNIPCPDDINLLYKKRIEPCDNCGIVYYHAVNKEYRRFFIWQNVKWLW